MISTKRKILFIFSLAISMLLLGCNSNGEETSSSTDSKENGSETTTGGTLNIGYAVQPPTLDPYISDAVATVDVMAHVFETLLVTDENFNIQPMLAESYEQSEDGKTITFKLREGVLFHNGKEMEAEDVVASLNRWKEVASAGRAQFSNATFEVVDKYTVELHLEEPMSTALSTLSFISSGSFTAIMPKEVIENSDASGIKEYIGTGPFKFEEWKQDQYIKLSRYDEYQPRNEEPSVYAGERKALVDELIFHITPDNSTLLAGVSSGIFDIGYHIGFDHIEQASNDPNIQIQSYKAAYLPLSFNKKQGLFTNAKARQAVAAALDMEQILKGAFAKEDFYELNGSLMMSHQLEQWSSDVGKDLYNERNTEKAKKLLEEAGYNGEEIVLITDKEYHEHYAAAVVIQDQLNKLGMNVKLEAYDWATLLDKTTDENAYDMYIYGFVPIPDPTSHVFLINDYPGWTESDELNEIIENMRSQATLEDAKDYYDDLQAWYWDYMPVVKIGDYDALVVRRNNVVGYDEQNDYNRPVFWNIYKE